LAGHHNPSFGAEVIQVHAIFGYATFSVLWAVLFYLALEPAVRRRWPWQFTAWNRLLAGRWRDPMLGRDLLVGLVIGTAVYALGQVARFVSEWAGYPTFLPAYTSAGGSRALVTPLYYSVMAAIPPAVMNAVYFLMLAFLLYIVVRRSWLAWIAMTLLVVALFAGPIVFELSFSAVFLSIEMAAFFVVVTVILSRVGMLAATACLLAGNLLGLFPLTLDTSAWYFWQGLCAAAVLLALAGFAFVTATRGQSLFTGGFLGDD